MNPIAELINNNARYNYLNSLTTNELVTMVSSGLIHRQRLGVALGLTSHDGNRDYDAILGYPKAEIDPEEFMARYDRQDLAGPIVDLPADDTWKRPPRIQVMATDETGQQVPDESDAGREFIETWQSLVDRLGLWSKLKRLDRLTGIGHYGVLLLGVQAVGELNQPLEGKPLSGSEGLLYVRPFSEVEAKIASFVTDHASARFGFPLLYNIDLGSQVGTRPVHWSRTLHVAENLQSDEVYGTPRLRRVYDRLTDMIKVVGGSSEALWLAMGQGFLLTNQPDYEIPMEDSDKEDRADMLERLRHGLINFLVFEGMQTTPLRAEGSGIDPTATFEVLLSCISAAVKIPQRILVGSAKGELAAARADLEQWASTIAARQTSFAEPDILRALITRFSQLGALPSPLPTYQVTWPPLYSPDELQEAERLHRESQTIATLADFGPVHVLTRKERRVALGYSADPPADMQDGPAMPSPPPVTLTANARSELSQFRQGIRAAVRGHWRGETDRFGFVDSMRAAIERRLTNAWNEGAASAGIAPDEQTPAEISARKQLINSQIFHVYGLALDIEEGSKAQGGKLKAFNHRIELWVNRFNEAFNTARMMAAADVKSEWRLNARKPTTKHCGDCLNMHGRVYRNSTWQKWDIRPQHDGLACGGLGCGCGFVDTDKPLTKGRPPAFRGKK